MESALHPGDDGYGNVEKFQGHQPWVGGLIRITQAEGFLH